MAATPDSGANDRLRTEFNDWAARGRGASMARHHAPITELTLARMDLSPGARVLDLGCGSGWTSRRLSPEVGQSGRVVGLDISDAMIAEAAQPPWPANVTFVCAPAEKIPCPDAAFTHILSVESFYYYPDQRAVLDELLRVVAPGGGIFLLMCIYRGHASEKEWVAGLKVPVTVRTPAEYCALLSDAGWREARSHEFLPPADAVDPDPHLQALLVSARR